MDIHYSDPLEKYPKVILNHCHFRTSANDQGGETLAQLLKLSSARQGPAGAAVIYYLRGRLAFAAYAEVLTGFQEVHLLPEQLREIVHCLQFWNQEGRKLYPLNGRPEENYQDFVLRCIAADCRAFVTRDDPQFLTERDEHTVWIDTRQGSRILTIRF